MAFPTRDNITNVATPIFTGNSAEVGSTITLLDGGTPVGTGIADGTGAWTITSSGLADGVHNLMAQAIDAVGNVSAPSAALSVTIDSTAPAAPSVPDLTAASDSGISNTDNITNVTAPTFTGTAESGTTVTLFDGATVVGTAVATGGNWTIVASTLASGLHNLVAQATDIAGNVGAISGALAVTIDTTPPAAPSIPDLDPASDTGGSNTDNITDVTTPVFDGTAEPGAKVELLEGATVLGSAFADNSGAWSITSSTLGSGVHNISARASDVAGNLGPTSGTLAVTIGSTTFRVTAFSANASGFDFTFNRSPYLADINLYDGIDAAVDVPDVILHANTANVDIHGSSGLQFRHQHHELCEDRRNSGTRYLYRDAA